MAAHRCALKERRGPVDEDQTRAAVRRPRLGAGLHRVIFLSGDRGMRPEPILGRPFRASILFVLGKPRALPWASAGRPYRA